MSGGRANYSGHAAARPRRTPPRTPETGSLRTVDQWEPNPGHRKHAQDLGVDYDEAVDAFFDRFGCLHGCTDLPARSSLNATFTAFIEAVHRDGDLDSLDDFPDHRYDCPHQENPW